MALFKLASPKLSALAMAFLSSKNPRKGLDGGFPLGPDHLVLPYVAPHGIVPPISGTREHNEHCSFLSLSCVSSCEAYLLRLRRDVQSVQPFLLGFSFRFPATLTPSTSKFSLFVLVQPPHFARALVLQALRGWEVRSSGRSRMNVAERHSLASFPHCKDRVLLVSVCFCSPLRPSRSWSSYLTWNS